MSKIDHVSDVDSFVEGFFKRNIQELFDNRCSAKTRQEIWDWIEETGPSPISFSTCCLFLGVDPERMSDAIAQMEAAQRRHERSKAKAASAKKIGKRQPMPRPTSAGVKNAPAGGVALA